MRIDLSSMLNGRVEKIDVNFDFIPEDRDDMAILPEGIKLSGPISVSGNIVDKNGYMLLKCNVQLEYDTFCDRCLDDIHSSFEMPFERMVASSKKMVIDDMVDEDDVLYIKEGFLDFENELMEELSLELPIYHLCREDCPGLCPKCGKRLADGDCGCKNEKEIDPRLAILKKLLDK